MKLMRHLIASWGLNGISRASVLIASGWERRLQNLLLTYEYCGFCMSCKCFVSFPFQRSP